VRLAHTVGVAQGLKEARRAVARGANDEALVLLWNAVEPARLRGDRRALATIGGLAQVVQRSGDDGQRREAERLLEVLRENAEHGVAPATATLDARVTGGGGYDAGEVAEGAGAVYEERELPDDVYVPEAGTETEGAGRAGRIGNLLWLAFVVLIILVNVIGQLRGG
jgi:hypothetical protein